MQEDTNDAWHGVKVLALISMERTLIADSLRMNITHGLPEGVLRLRRESTVLLRLVNLFNDSSCLDSGLALS